MAAFVATLDRFSGGRIHNKNDLTTLLSLPHDTGESPIERIAFLAKFSVKSRKIMNRIGKDGEGYDALSAELSRAVDEITSLLRDLFRRARRETGQALESRYLALSPEGITNLFSLLEDLAWYKNWLIDHRQGEP